MYLHISRLRHDHGRSRAGIASTTHRWLSLDLEPDGPNSILHHKHGSLPGPRSAFERPPMDWGEASRVASCTTRGHGLVSGRQLNIPEYKSVLLPGYIGGMYMQNRLRGNTHRFDIQAANQDSHDLAIPHHSDLFSISTSGRQAHQLDLLSHLNQELLIRVLALIADDGHSNGLTSLAIPPRQQ